MGMSDDYPVAVEEGATIVRVGRAIFGERRAEPARAPMIDRSVRSWSGYAARRWRDRVDGVGEDGVLRVRVAGAARRRRREHALIRLIAARAARRRANVRIVAGAAAAGRRVAVDGRDAGGHPCPLAGPRAMIGRLGRDARWRSGAIGSVG